MYINIHIRGIRKRKMIESLHYVSPSKNITLDVYRHTLFVGINGALTNESTEQVLLKYFEFINVLNENFKYWGQIISLNTELVLTSELGDLLLSGHLDATAQARKCVDVTVLRGIPDDSVSALATFLPDVPFHFFDTLPKAMAWVDSFMNWYAVEHNVK